MTQPKKPSRAKRVWRVSAANPKGEWIDTAGAAELRPRQDKVEVSDRSWRSSSHDLLDGSVVIENSDTVPGELLDEISVPKPNPLKSAGK
jgi:hypothetical protein